MKGMEGGEVKLTPHPGKTILKKRIVQRLLLFFLIFFGFSFSVWLLQDYTKHVSSN